MKRYDKYKDSGVEWIGEIPEHWECKRLGTWFTERREKVSDKDFEPLSVTKNGIVSQLETAAKSNDGDNRKGVYSGDFVINSRSDRKGSSGLAKKNGSVSLINIVMKLRNINADFSEFLLKSNSFIEEFYRNGHGIVADLWTTRFEDMKFINIPIPSIAEQQAIASFLDDKTAKIDQTISIKEKEIELLKERRQILIQKAVTKGLDATVPMKDSGVDWIGEIPEHWEVRKLRFEFNLNKGLTITKENLTDEGIYCVNYGEIHSKYGFEVNPKIHPLRSVSEEYLHTNQNSLLKNGDFIFADTSEDLAGSGNFTYLNSNEMVFAGYHTVVVRPKDSINSKFFAYEFDSQKFRNQIRTKMKGVKVFSITQSTLKDLIIWIPPFQEQIAITNFLDTKLEKISKAISLKQQEIEKLKEYKTVLIDNVVTGKVKVS